MNDESFQRFLKRNHISPRQVIGSGIVDAGFYIMFCRERQIRVMRADAAPTGADISEETAKRVFWKIFSMLI